MGEPKPARVLNWTPLEKAVPPSLLGAFMHMGEVGTIQQYKHRDTRRYLCIDSNCTRFYDLLGEGDDGGFVEIDRGAALRYALEMCCCADPGACFAGASESLRAAALLSAFLELQWAIGWWVLDEPDEAWEMILLLSYLNDETRLLAPLITDQLKGKNLCSFERQVQEIQEAIEALKVPPAWLSPPEEGDRPPATMVRAWRTFCEQVATETGKAPSYGVARVEEPRLVEEPSLAEPCSENDPLPEVTDSSHELSLVDPVMTVQPRVGFLRRFRDSLGL